MIERLFYKTNKLILALEINVKLCQSADFVKIKEDKSSLVENKQFP